MNSVSIDDGDLIEKISLEFDVPATTLRGLLVLEHEFPNMSAHGAKARLGRRVEEIVSESLESKD